eukprot:jgi/Pico_ML_1/54298/g4668.t2
MKANASRTAPSHANVEKVNAELFTFTYGAVVRQLIEDYEDLDEVNKQLDEMGYNVGVRIIDDFLAKSEADKCSSFEGTVETIASSAFRMFLGATIERDVLKGDEVTEIRLRLLERIPEEYPFKDDE